ncbi:hypothetical protein AVEN_149110-1 [Araneus ventricosus]|uniref:Uncharacterized protein n=1 Tax=Araneus ventricosus TaxID=182803 RepID=A0A4Y2UXU2_ARAVE|nr:hypothetical protein AVEN_149110-1 [Araneus ventricosus]
MNFLIWSLRSLVDTYPGGPNCLMLRGPTCHRASWQPGQSATDSNPSKSTIGILDSLLLEYAVQGKDTKLSSDKPRIPDPLFWRHFEASRTTRVEAGGYSSVGRGPTGKLFTNSR